MEFSFFTRVTLQDRLFSLTYKDKILLLGSCFSQHMGVFLEENLFFVDLNPFGILYNPSSIAASLRRLIKPKPFAAEELIRHKGLYHSLSHHGSFSASSTEEVLALINQRYQPSTLSFGAMNILMITFGSAYLYRWKETGEVVANCHKLSEERFVRERLSVAQIVDEWSPLLSQLIEQNSEMRLLFTVSPIRHWRDGAHDNQLSKSILLLAIDQLQSAFPHVVDYFPAYEIMMDELRDYRFYAEDMCHPSAVAIQYLRERLVEAYMDRSTRAIMSEVAAVNKLLAHRPLRPGGEGHQQTLEHALHKIEGIEAKYPYLCFGKVKERVETQLRSE